MAMLGLPARAQDKTKVGFVYVGPIGDGGWTFEHNNGRLAVEADAAPKVELAIAKARSERFATIDLDVQG